MKHLRTSLLALGGLLAAAGATYAQPTPLPTGPAANPYRETPPKPNALVHTKLDVRFDYAKRHLLGKAWLTLRPYAYATDSLRLDAKGMDLQTVALVTDNQKTQPLKYSYADQTNLRIALGRQMKPGENYTVYIEYTAKPDELKVKGSAAINDAKGLYFINPDSTQPGKPRQIWTQGETEASSCWFPTIDRPNQKTTSEISMTVPARYVTLSNGRLDSQKPNGDGTRTDTWKMEQPHAPYLFMMAVGDFKIYKDTWRGKEVSYYLEPKYAPFAKQIFGNTPDMLEFFSNRLGVEYPWNKYSQIVCRDYVSGAMENTTATLHGEFLQMTDKELLDREYSNESVIAHELFHQWFGDYVTTESWSNLTVNESFADFSEALYAEHKYGREAADAHNYRYLRRYLASSPDAEKPLVRFHYADKEDMFDLVSYQKGGAILHMLRTYLGDDVFFAGLQKYLKDNAFGNGEAHQLRLALEATSGQDLNWFFNQWYFRAGHPVVTIDYAWDAAKKVQTVTVQQTQPGEPFRLPFAIDYYVKGKPQRQRVIMTQATQTFSMALPAKPELVNVDAEKVLVWQKADHKPMTEFLYQYKNAPLFVDRREALEVAQTPDNANTPAARAVLLAGLQDKFYTQRINAIRALNLDDAATRKAAVPALRKLAATEQEPHVQAEALLALGKLKDKKDAKLFAQQLDRNPSYTVQGAALTGLAATNSADALRRAQALESAAAPALSAAVLKVYAEHGTAAQWPVLRQKFDAATTFQLEAVLPAMASFLVRTDDATAFQEGVDRIKGIGIKYKNHGADKFIIGLLQGIKQQKASGATAATAGAVVDKAVADIQEAK